MQIRLSTTSAIGLGVLLLAGALISMRCQSEHVSESSEQAFRHLTGMMAETIRREHRSEFLAMYNAFKPHGIQRAEYEQMLVFASARVYDPFFIDFVVASGADINCRNKDGQNCMHAVAERSDEIDAAEQIWHLAELGLNVTQPDNNGETVGHYAARNNRAVLLMSLPSKYQGLINAQNKLGQTPLMLCAQLGYDQAAAVLLGRGASITIRDHEGRTALDYASTPPGPDSFEEGGVSPESKKKLQDLLSKPLPPAEGGRATTPEGKMGEPPVPIQANPAPAKP